MILAIFFLWIAANFALVLFIHACACADKQKGWGCADRVHTHFDSRKGS